MENCATISGRRRGSTKHSVEDQALDQIAKEVRQNIFFSKIIICFI